MRASSESGGKSLSQYSQFGRSCSITELLRKRPGLASLRNAMVFAKWRKGEPDPAGPGHRSAVNLA
jgi:hypothetical protein